MENTLYFGDNLDILRHKIPTASVDLVYLDPPFNSNADYNVLFKDQSGQLSPAQIQAFTDTWHWSDAAERAREEVLTRAAPGIASMLDAMVYFIGRNDLTAYLVMMTQRLIELHRVLKPTGSLYLHCDPTASHYLKIVLDTIFGPEHFRSEIIWRRTNTHNKTTRQYGPIHDTILFYTKSDDFTFHPGVRPYTRAYIGDRFKYQDGHGIFQTNYLTGPGIRHGESGEAWRGFNPTEAGRHWAVPKSLRPFLPNDGAGMSSHEQLEALNELGYIVFPKKVGGQPMYKQYLGDGVPYQDVWAYQPNTRGVLYGSDECIDEDVKYLEGEPEKLGYETQKPIGLLARIIETSSDSGDVVLDPFCGCGTAICAAQKLDRQWIGIDITHLAVSLMKSRLKSMFDLEPNHGYVVDGEPRDVSGAQQLALLNRYQFQYWAVSLLEAVPQEQHEQKKGADKGIDGVISFLDGSNRRRETVIVQVKSGHVTSSHIRDLKGVLEREKAALGLYICLEKPTRDMLEEAASAGFYTSDLWPGPKRDHRWPRIQIRTIEDLLNGRNFEIPPRPVQFKPAERVSVQPTMPGLWSMPESTVVDLPELLDEEEQEEE
jgi:site-specific DNA-methyltransferase (adenine-specific)